MEKLSTPLLLASARKLIAEMAERHHLEIGTPHNESKLMVKMLCLSFISFLSCPFEHFRS